MFNSSMFDEDTDAAICTRQASMTVKLNSLNRTQAIIMNSNRHTICFHSFWHICYILSPPEHVQNHCTNDKRIEDGISETRVQCSARVHVCARL